MSPKEKVRANIYKALLEEEKRKNKRMSIFSIGLFFVGIVTMSTYNSLVKSVPNNEVNNENNIVASGEVREALLSSIYDNSSVIGTKTTQLNPDELFIYNNQI
ncbi:MULTISPECIES: hypothetical protein [Fusobacterium]|uniref:Uncharacterized protein n=8 Tax=Fusobacterium TaxID=848 RepID=F9EP64_9FUSO|nr:MULTISPECIES: hypothetical protein [Fusobacterium]EFD80300.1 hypothetical protein PSAG_00335 [Fusobacterium animalis D11]EGQ79255.1 hypothetical protein HMPREF9094_1719 [Fusobacterium animalis ATCC 51191]AGM23966.1 hypothetical protein HMPREF0409_02378 [Fusobacterium animalis 4_8]ALF18328.1 hypothetical protein RN98_09115 [Fusobacterium animalis]ALF21976.1 hypothetical protein RO08_06545 [Fusobacterium animalis]